MSIGDHIRAEICRIPLRFYNGCNHNPSQRQSALLVSLTDGLVATDIVNCDTARDIGLISMKAMVGKPFSEVHLKRKGRVQSLSAVNKGMRIRGEIIHVNPEQLFHRMLCTVRSDEELAEFLTFELAARPPALFDDFSLRKGTKSTLLKPLKEHVPPEIELPAAVASCIIDGGYLLHRVVWTRPSTYGQICQKYVTYVKDNCNAPEVTVVFYGTKYHLLRMSNMTVEQMIPLLQTMSSKKMQILQPRKKSFFLIAPIKPGSFSALRYFDYAGIQVLSRQQMMVH